MPEALASKYIPAAGDTCQADKRVRDMVIFSEHNLLHDPAFLRLDLVSCRNLLIYLQPAVQHRVLNTFAHALKATGLLFLGKAEALYANAELFSVVDGSGHLYRSRGTAGWRNTTRVRQSSSAQGKLGAAKPGVNKGFDLGAWLTNAHAEGALAPFVVVDDTGRLLHVFGDFSRFLRLGPGLATLDVLQLAIEPIRLELRSTLLHAQRQRNQHMCTDILLADGALRLQLVGMRREDPGTPSQTLLLFDLRASALPHTESPGGQAEHDALRAALEEQLTTMRDHLSTVISELESSNEELQSLNEEMQSANEELQSANEELETSNEKLIMVNEELESRTTELSLLNADLQDVKDSQDDALIVVDEHQRVTLFNPPSKQHFALDAASAGALLY